MKEIFTKPELVKAEDRCREYALTPGWAACDVQTVLNGLNFYRSLAMSLTCEVERLKTDTHAPTVSHAIARQPIERLALERQNLAN